MEKEKPKFLEYIDWLFVAGFKVAVFCAVAYFAIPILTGGGLSVTDVPGSVEPTPVATMEPMENPTVAALVVATRAEVLSKRPFEPLVGSSAYATVQPITVEAVAEPVQAPTLEPAEQFAAALFTPVAAPVLDVADYLIIPLRYSLYDLADCVTTANMSMSLLSVDCYEMVVTEQWRCENNQETYGLCAELPK